jgi:hypothetical protein
MKPTLFLIAGLGLVLTSCNKAEPKIENKKTASHPNWQAFSTDYFSLTVPNSWENFFAKIGTDTESWALGPVTTLPVIGEMGPDKIYIVRNGGHNKGKDLTQLVKQTEAKWKSSTTPGRFIGRPRSARMGTGKCIAYRLEHRRSDCNNINPRTQKRNACYVRHVVAVCNDRAGDYYEFRSRLGNYIEPGKPTPEIVTLGNTVEKVLASLEFKKS